MENIINKSKSQVNLKEKTGESRASKHPVSSWALVAHSCNPSYSGGRDKEDGRSKPSPGK
jgi:hypothetical protein